MNKLAKQQNSVGIAVNNNELTNVSKSEISIYNANLQSKKFKDYTTQKDLLLMNALITRWANYIGVKQPQAVDLNTISNAIKESFPNFNEYDLNVLINLLVNGKLETDAEHYGSMSVIYCLKVLRSYQDYKFNILHKVRDEIKKVESQKPKPINKQERLNNFKELLLHAKDTSNKETFVDVGSVIYYFAWKNKLMPISEDLKNEAICYGEKRFSEEKKKKYLEATIKHHSYKTLSDLKFQEKDTVNKYAREYVVNLWLKKTNIQSIIDKLTYQMIDY
jgi:hypothetical protein